MKPFKAAATYTADLQQAYDYFEQGGPAAADRFLLRYERALQQIMGNPLSCRLRQNGWRQLTIPGSTYGIFFREAPDFWYLGGVISTVQDPDLVQARLLIREIRAPDPELDQ
jgi:plasmid stabilization system protein ParE